VTELQNYIRPYIKFFGGNTSMDVYAKVTGCKFGPHGHPLEDGHRVCFDYVSANFDMNKIQTT
jgi:hypothetical protein